MLLNSYNCSCRKQAQGQVVKQQHQSDLFSHENHNVFTGKDSIIFIDTIDPLVPKKESSTVRYSLNILESV